MRRFYNPALTEDQIEELDWKNFVLVQSAQAALGNISSDMCAVFVEARRRGATLHFVVASGREAACREDVEDTISELGGLLAPDQYDSLDAQIHVDDVPKDWPARGWRGLYWRKGWGAWSEGAESE